jgi:hypothetical protein
MTEQIPRFQKNDGNLHPSDSAKKKETKQLVSVSVCVRAGSSIRRNATLPSGLRKEKEKKTTTGKQFSSPKKKKKKIDPAKQTTHVVIIIILRDRRGLYSFCDVYLFIGS